MPVGVTAVVVLAAGAGTRMKSSVPKVMHPIAGKPLVWHALSAAQQVGPDRIVAVIGHGREQVSAYLAAELPDVRTAVQDQQLGTGHAVECALAELGDLTGTLLVTYGDVPLLRPQTLLSLAETHTSAGNAVTVLTAELSDPTGYGRIVRDTSGALSAIVEQRDATAEQRRITEVNSGVYAFDAAVLVGALSRLTSSNSQGERYLTDVVGIVGADGGSVGTVTVDDATETEGVNDRVQLADLARALNARLVRAAQLAGVTVQDPQTTWLHADVQLEPDVTILRNTSLEAGTVVERGSVIGPDTTLIDCRVGPDATVLSSYAHGAVIGPRASVGPYAHLRAGSELATGARVGAYVEMKGARIGPGAKVPHLSYIGDAEVGADSNIGAGTITANYDGVSKSRTTIGDGTFVGSNSTLVAPLTLGPGSYIAAGSTVTDDTVAGALAVARGRQATKPGWVLARKPGTTMARAAIAATEAAGAEPATDMSPQSSAPDGAVHAPGSEPS